MDFVNYVISYISRVIPREVLDLATSNDRLTRMPKSLESKVENELLRPSFLSDMNLITGMELIIPIKDLEYNNDNNGVTLLKFSDSVLQGRRLINALSLADYSQYDTGVLAASSGEAFATVMETGNSWMISSVTSKLEVISPNEVLVYNNVNHIYELAMRVTVELSNNFSEINSKSYPALADIALLAVQTVIYTKLRVKLAQSHLYHGHELGVMNDIVSEYSNAHRDYYEKLPLMKKTVFMNDSVSMQRFIKQMIPNNV